MKSQKVDIKIKDKVNKAMRYNCKISHIFLKKEKMKDYLMKEGSTKKKVTYTVNNNAIKRWDKGTLKNGQIN